MLSVDFQPSWFNKQQKQNRLVSNYGEVAIERFECAAVRHSTYLIRRRYLVLCLYASSSGAYLHVNLMALRERFGSGWQQPRQIGNLA